MTTPRKPPKNNRHTPLYVDRDEEINLIKRSKKKEKERSGQKVPVRIDSKTIIFVDSTKDPEKEKRRFLNKLEQYK